MSALMGGLGLRASLAVLSRCDVLAVVGGITDGVRREIQLADDLAIAVVMLVSLGKGTLVVEAPA